LNKTHWPIHFYHQRKEERKGEEEEEEEEEEEIRRVWMEEKIEQRNRRACMHAYM
jgi:hypothetical protein